MHCCPGLACSTEYLLLVDWPFKPSRCIKASYYFPENKRNFSTNKGFRMKIFMKLDYQYIAIFFNFSTTSNHLYTLQVNNCDSNSRLVVYKNETMVNSGLIGSNIVAYNTCTFMRNKKYSYCIRGQPISRAKLIFIN